MNFKKSEIKLMITHLSTNRRSRLGMTIRSLFGPSNPARSFFLENFDPNGKDLTPFPLIIPMVLSNSLMNTLSPILQSMDSN